MRNSNFTHGGNIYKHAKELNIPPSEIIDSSASLVPFPPPEFLIKALYSVLESQSFQFYPESNLNKIREVIADFHNINQENIMPGNGASELITWIGNTAANLGKNCLLTPGFVDYERSLNCWKGECIFEELPKKCQSNFSQKFPLKPITDVIWITNPHNPSGHLWKRASIEDILNEYKLVICDEAFLSITPNGEKESLIPLIKKYKNLIVIRSLTKLFNIAGIRLGYAIASPETIENLNHKRDPWPLNTFAIEAGIKLLENNSRYENWTLQIHNWIIAEKDFLRKELSKIKHLNVYNSATNFFLIENKNSLKPAIKYLASKGILIRDCSSFRSLDNKWARISLKNHENNQIIANELINFLGTD